MRLLSATVRNYRIHRETTVDFTDSLNLVGGPNESGKSTFAEAIHRAFFLKAAIGGKAQKAMVSDTHQGHPEVEVRFRAGQKEYEIKKLFSGTNGKATLGEGDGGTLHGDDAEAKLATLLGVDEPGGGTGGANKSLAQWGHLWVWQGEGGVDPSDHTAPQRDALLSRLKDEGGGAAMMSEFDSAVASKIEEKFGEHFTRSGNVKAGSDLKRAEEEKADAEDAVAKAESVSARLEQAVRDFAQAETIIRTHDEKNAGLTAQLEKARTALKTVDQLRHRLEIDERNFQEIDTKLQSLRKSIEEVTRLENEVEALGKKLEPAAATAKQLMEKSKSKKGELSEAEAALEKAEASVATSREEMDLAKAWVDLFEARARSEDLDKRQAEIEKLVAERKKHDAELAGLPPIDSDTLKEMREISSGLARAEAVLKATSTGIEVVRASETVQAGGTELTEGTEHTIDRETLLTVGDSLELRITPGGGTELEEARGEVAELQRRSSDLSSKTGVDSPDEGAAVLTKRQEITGRIRELNAELAGRDADAIADLSDEASRRLEAAEADVKRRTEKLPDFAKPSDRESATQSFEDLRAAAERSGSEITEARALRDEARKAFGGAETEAERAIAANREAEQNLADLKTRLATKSEPLGPVEERESKLRKLRDEYEAAQSKLEATREKLAELQPEALEADVSRLTRAIKIGKTEYESAIGKKAAAQSILQTDGTTDPASDLETARARLESATERHASLEKRASAIKLLHEKFTAEQQRLSDRFSRPLAEKVSGYLQQIFGPTASASVSVEDGHIGGWTMSRDGQAFEFDKLSGGTREQVSAAVRLAIAEILSADHDGSLPVVFDDAFTNSDPDRIASLQRMLDLAARNGLQIILLTCDPTDYTGLGANMINL